MVRLILVGFALFASGISLVRADSESLPLSVVESVKRASVYLQVQDPRGKGSGSGFVVWTKDDTALIVTNYHVIASPSAERRSTLSPREVVKVCKAAQVTAVFDSSLKTERSLKAEVIAADPQKDLAILRVNNLKDPPAPIDYASGQKLTETMNVYSFGFPFGQALATSKSAPAITVGKATVSSIRLDDKGNVAVVQIDGALNPGNSGGPIVDSQGKLVGVAVAIVKDSKGIGLAIPTAELVKMMKGRLGPVHMITAPEPDGKIKVKVEVPVIDPIGAIRGASLHYLSAEAKKPGEKEPASLEKQIGSRNTLLKLDDGVASGEFTLDAITGPLLVQTVQQLPYGKPALNPIQTVSLTGAGSAANSGGAGAADPGKPPAGWKEYTPKDNAFTIWLPEKTVRQSERERTSTIKGQRLKVTMTLVEVTPGVTYQVQRLALPLALARNSKRGELEQSLRDALVAEMRGKVTDETDCKLGPIPGREYFVEMGNGITRLRIFVSGLGNRVFILGVSGNEQAVKSDSATTFLDSCRLPTVVANPDNPDATKPNTDPAKPTGGAKVTRILGGAFDKEFKDTAPEGGLLVGFEIGLGKFVNNDIVRAIRPVYRVGTAEDTLGEQRGMEPTKVVKVIAKPGYAVGMITAKAGLTVDGMSVKFMKINGNRLDPSDSYESEWVGGMGGGPPTKLGGDGTPVVGIIGKANAKDCTGLGLALDTPKAAPEKK